MINEQPIAVLQLIDSLAAGGAERMSVNLANALAREEGVRSFLCATRQGGPLEETIGDGVETTILHKRSAFDPIALWQLVRFIRKHRVEIVHAHATSWFMAVQCKLLTGVKVVWHDHNGKRGSMKARYNNLIVKFSFLFDSVFVVNKELFEWGEYFLKINKNNIHYLPNFAILNLMNTNLILPGEDGKRIVCLANLRDPKGHIFLIDAFKKISCDNAQWHLLLVGKDYEDDYSINLKKKIEKYNLSSKVHLLGSRNDTADILQASTIGVLSSESEGLPVALLEYGLAGLPVVCTDVGECSEVLLHGECGKIVPAKDPEVLANALEALMGDQTNARQYARRFQEHVKSHYSKEAVMQQILHIYKELLDA